MLERLVGHSRRAARWDEVEAQIAATELDLIVARNVPALAMPGGFLVTDDYLEASFVQASWQLYTTGKFVIYFSSTSQSVLPVPHRTRARASTCLHIEYEVARQTGELEALALRSTDVLGSAQGLPYWQLDRGQPLLVDSWLVRTDEGPCAFYSTEQAKDGDGPRGVLVVPADLCNQVAVTEWVAAALRLWKQSAGDAFVSVRTWQEEDVWSTRLERQIEKELTAIQAERDRAIEQFADGERQLHERLQLEKSRADTSERRLLTSQGSELVEAVVAALSQLGFHVEIPQSETTTAKGEDLLITRAEWPGWQASVEVKGFVGSGARLPDVVKLDRRRKLRGSRQAIMIVNGEFGLPPAARHRPFEGNEECREAVVEMGVLVVDSRELYRALSDALRAERFVLNAESGTGVYADSADVALAKPPQRRGHGRS